MRTRPFSFLLLLAGLTTGTIADRGADRTRARSEGPAVLTADLHVHAFPGDGVLPAWELRKEARRRGIDVIAITNHNQSIAASFPAGGRPGSLPIVIPGQEITAPEFHLIAAGVRRVVDWRLPLEDAIAAVHAQGGVAIAAHPVRDSWRAGNEAALQALDGVEAVHALGERHSRGRYELLQFYRTLRERKPTLAAIGSSDFHASVPLGRCFTYVVADEVSERGVLSAIRGGRTVAADNHGTLVGDPAMVKLVEGSLAARNPRSGPLAGLSVFMVLGALALLVCLE